jgi:uncharacterized NAD(P)/FAD-binding protein YdhS
MFDRVGDDSMGPAYSNDSDDLLLNVPAAQMGAFAEDPEHFLTWVREQGGHVEPGDFLPRRLFRDYIFALMSEAVSDCAGDVSLEHVRGEVTDIELDGQCATVHVEGGKPFTADVVVLALGNFPPRHPPIANRPALESERYAGSPWDVGVLDSLSQRDSVVFIGTGQTMVDLALMLHRRGHRGSVIGFSRHGLLPVAHGDHESYPTFFEEISGSTRLLDIFRRVREHLDRASAMGIDGRAVIDSLRPDTQALWSSLPEAEKCRFMRHLFRHWERIRSRIPPESGRIIEKLRAAGQLRIVAGRVHDLVETRTAIEVHYTPRRHSTREVERAALVVNCIGPEADYRRIDHPLVENLLRRGLIRPGPAHLGIAALPNGAVIAGTGDTSGVLYTLGATMRGVLWEVVAVPDIRVQAERLAQLLLSSSSPRAA